jgi:endonuclease/exonuclease/phosphatase family metal-dependent hydrolase
VTGARLGIVSYNLKDYGKSIVEVRERQHELLRSLRPDMVCLQEIWDDTEDLTQLRVHLATIGAAVGLSALAVPARRSHCHMAILWRSDYRVLYQRCHGLSLWHGLGVVQLDVGGGVPLRVAVTHMPPWDPDKRLSDTRTVAALLDDPEQATVIAGDWNSLGADHSYDPEPQWSKLRAGTIWRHIRWTDTPDTAPRADRRPAQLLQRSGLYDAAPHLRAPWQATGGHMGDDMPRRLDAFWTTRPQALRRYQVIDTPAARRLSDFSEHEERSQFIDPRELSDHLPIMIELDPGAL